VLKGGHDQCMTKEHAMLRIKAVGRGTGFD
jgi:hypothetical protein